MDGPALIIDPIEQQAVVHPEFRIAPDNLPFQFKEDDCNRFVHPRAKLDVLGVVGDGVAQCFRLKARGVGVPINLIGKQRKRTQADAVACFNDFKIIIGDPTDDNNGSTGGNNNQTTTDGNKGNNEGTKLSSDKIQEAVAAITTAKAGDTYTVDMSDATVAPKDVLEAAKGKDVDIVLNMNGYKWTINGNNIQADNLKDINLAVDTDSDAIPDDVISELAGNNPVKQISLAYSGDFGFKASLTYNIGSEYAGKYGNLYYYDSTGRMIFQNAGAIDADGNISLNFSHASEYAVVIADYAVTTENADNTATGGIATGDSTPIALYAVLCVMAIALAGIAAVTRKKNV